MLSKIFVYIPSQSSFYITNIGGYMVNCFYALGDMNFTYYLSNLSIDLNISALGYWILHHHLWNFSFGILEFVSSLVEFLLGYILEFVLSDMESSFLLV